MTKDYTNLSCFFLFCALYEWVRETSSIWIIEIHCGCDQLHCDLLLLQKNIICWVPMSETCKTLIDPSAYTSYRTCDKSTSSDTNVSTVIIIVISWSGTIICKRGCGIFKYRRIAFNAVLFYISLSSIWTYILVPLIWWIYTFHTINNRPVATRGLYQ